MNEWTLRIMAIAEKRISRIPNAEKKRILMAIDELRYDPFAHDVISLSGRRASSESGRVESASADR